MRSDPAPPTRWRPHRRVYTGSRSRSAPPRDAAIHSRRIESPGYPMSATTTAHAFTNATLLDGTKDMAPAPGSTVIVERGVITAVGPADAIHVPAEARVIDVQGDYLMPGLINMHVHFCGSGKPVSAGRRGPGARPRRTRRGRYQALHHRRRLRCNRSRRTRRAAHAARRCPLRMRGGASARPARHGARREHRGGSGSPLKPVWTPSSTALP